MDNEREIPERMNLDNAPAASADDVATGDSEALTLPPYLEGSSEETEAIEFFDSPEGDEVSVSEDKPTDLKELEVDKEEVLDLGGIKDGISEEEISLDPEHSTDNVPTDNIVKENQEIPVDVSAFSAESLDSILYDENERGSYEKDADESTSYERSLADYRKTMMAAFSALSARSSEEDGSNNVESQEDGIPNGEETTNNTTDNEHIAEFVPDFSGAPEHSDLPDSNSTSNESISEFLEYKEEDTEQMVIDFGEIPFEEASDAQGESDDAEEVSIPEKNRDEKYDPSKPRRIDSVFEMVELFIFTLAAVLILATFFFRHSVVDGKSMDDTLEDGEHLIISDFLYTPKRGDIIVFEDREANIKTPYIKRVIGIPGDTVRIEADGSVYVNGELLEEDYVTHRPVKDKELTCTVEEGKLFVLGDQRRVSEDSRSFGLINDDGVLGKVILRIYPFSKFGTVE